MGRVPVSTIARAIVAVGLLLLFYVAGFALLAGLVWATIVLAQMAGAVPDFAFATATLAVGLIYPLWQIARAGVTQPPGAVLDEEQAPALWTLVRDVAAAVGTRPPDEIRLTDEVNAGVWEDAGRIGLGRGRRCLYLGVPLLVSIDDRQLMALLAHEMGHYAQGHTVFGAIVYRGGRSMRETIDRVGPNRAGGVVLSAFAAVYFLVALTVMRSMEYAADRAAVRMAGPIATRSLLTSIPILAATWDDTLWRYIATAEEDTAGDRYDQADLIDAFIHAERSEARPRERTPWDSHPPDADRLAAIGDEPVPGGAGSGPAVDLVGDRGALTAALTTEAFAARVVASAYRRADDLSGTLYRAAEDVNGRDYRGLGGVLDILGAGRAGFLAGRLSRPDLLADYVRCAISARLVRSAGARWVHVWGEQLTLRTAGGDVIDLRAPIEAACADPARVPALRLCLRDLGLPEPPGANPTSARPGFDTGLAFRRLPDGAPSEPLSLLLPDRLYLLAHYGGGRRIPADVLETAIAAAALAELRRLNRIVLVDGAVATVAIVDEASTGDRFLDSVLVHLVDSAPRPAYQWLQAIGPDAAATIRRRLSLAGFTELNDLPAATGTAEIVRLRTGLLATLRSPDPSGTPGEGELLAMLLWAAELTKPVFGWSVVAPRWFLGRLAARDPLMIGVRIVTGLSITLPSAGGGMESS
jgi:Zn-dependent protease with chaperone function